MTREVEFDDVEREKILAIAEHDARICDCGFHESVADTDPALALDLRVCPVCAGSAQRARQMTADDEQEVKQMYGGLNPPPGSPLPDDGRHTRLRFKPPTEQTP